MDLIDHLRDWLQARGVSAGFAEPGAIAVGYGGAILVAALLAWIANQVTRRVVLGLLHRFAAKTRTKWDDALVARKVFHRLAHLAPAAVIYLAAPVIFAGLDGPLTFAQNAALVYMLVVVLASANAFLDAAHDIYRTYEVSRRVPVRGFLQVIKLVGFFVGALLFFSILTGRSPGGFLAGLGALSAVLMLVFKDAILGFVAGIQLTTNRMVQVGDWITMPKYGADGDVIEINLTTVKVQNFDKTVVTIPAYALVSDSVRNWRGMKESGGRRIKRAVHLDMNAIRFCNEEMLERFAKIRQIARYIESKRKELEEHNATLPPEDRETLANARRLTNVGTFRAYVVASLRDHPKIHQEMTFLIRQLPPGPEGLPIEIYVFTNDTDWVRYEGIQSDIFDHLLAILPEFDLRAFQRPSGGDFRALENALLPARD